MHVDPAIQTPWCSAGPSGSYGPLDRNGMADVCVIGAGIAGLATAYELGRGGRRVLVLDDGVIGGGETGRSSAHLASAVDDRFYRIESLHGEKAARLCYESHAAAIDWLETVVALEGIDCDFARRDAFLFAPPGEDPGLIEREYAAARRAQVAGLHRVRRAPLPLYDTGDAICFPGQAQCDPMALLLGLARAVEAADGRICCGTHVTRISSDGGLRVECRNGLTVLAGAVVVATNSPINNLVTLHTKQHAYRTYAIGLPVERGTIHPALYWDTSSWAGDESGAYHYVRLMRERPGDGENGNGSDADEVLIVGGEDHKTGQADDAVHRWSRLETWAGERFPVVRARRYQWSGQVMEPVDRLAFIGLNPSGPDQIYVITGDSGMGLTHAAIGAMLIADLMAERPNSWATLYDPARKSLRAVMAFVKENVNTAAQYADWLRPGALDSPDAIPVGSGALVRRGLKLLACARDEDGVLHECSAACPHLGGVVQWNSAERTWDCPCHGSRFALDGEVLNGPAISSLARTHVLTPEAASSADR